MEQEELVVIIQARMNSVRFPGKSMFLIDGKPALQHLLDSVLHYFDKNQIVIATSSLPTNDEIRILGIENEIKVFSGEELNVASRFFSILESTCAKYFVRLNGDSPLFCAKKLEEFLNSEAFKIPQDLYSTSFNRTYPKGANFEIVKVSTFQNNYRLFNSSEHFEHVTKYFYDHLEQFKIDSISLKDGDYSDVNLCFDTVDDLNLLKGLFENFSKPHYHYTLAEKCQAYIAQTGKLNG